MGSEKPAAAAASIDQDAISMTEAEQLEEEQRKATEHQIKLDPIAAIETCAADISEELNRLIQTTFARASVPSFHAPQRKEALQPPSAMPQELEYDFQSQQSATMAQSAAETTAQNASAAPSATAARLQADTSAAEQEMQPMRRMHAQQHHSTPPQPKLAVQSPNNGYYDVSDLKPTELYTRTYFENALEQLKLVRIQSTLYIAQDNHAANHAFLDAVEATRAEFTSAHADAVGTVISSVAEAADGKFAEAAINLAKGLKDAIFKGMDAKQEMIDILAKREELSIDEKIAGFGKRISALQEMRDRFSQKHQEFLEKLPGMAQTDRISQEDEAKLRGAGEKIYRDLNQEMNTLSARIHKAKREIEEQKNQSSSSGRYGLARELFALFLIRDQGTAAGFFTWFWNHPNRRRDIANALCCSNAIPRNNIDGNSQEVKAFTAKLKRIAANDMNSQTTAYAKEMYRIEKALDILRRSGNTTPALAPLSQVSFKEKLSFYSDIYFNQTELAVKALHEASLLDPRPSRIRQAGCNCSITVARYGDQVEQDHRDYLQRLYHSLRHDKKPEMSAEEMVEKLNTIISAYYRIYVDKMSTFARDTLGADINDPEVMQAIHARAQKLLSRELADDTPSNYYAAPLAGIALFVTGIKGGKSRIAIRHNLQTGAKAKLHIDYGGEALTCLQNANPLQSEEASTLRRRVSTKLAMHRAQSQDGPHGRPRYLDIQGARDEFTASSGATSVDGDDSRLTPSAADAISGSRVQIGSPPPRKLAGARYQ